MPRGEASARVHLLLTCADALASVDWEREARALCPDASLELMAECVAIGAEIAPGFRRHADDAERLA